MSYKKSRKSAFHPTTEVVGFPGAYNVVKYEGNRQLLDYPCLDFSKNLRPYLLRWKPEVLIPVPVREASHD